MALILRSEIGRRLTVPEIDGNFTYLENLAKGLTAGVTIRFPDGATAFDFSSIGTVSVLGDILPYSNDVYNLGSTTSKWNNIYTKDLYVASQSIYIGDLKLSSEDGALLVNGNIISSNNGSIAINTDEVGFGTGTGLTSSGNFKFNSTCDNFIQSKNSTIATSSNSTIIGGACNIIEGFGIDNSGVSVKSFSSTITGGQCNTLSNSNYSSIVGGNCNTIEGGLDNSGKSISSFSSTITGGQCNTISNSSNSSIVGGGSGNSIASFSNLSSIVGGSSNTLSCSSNFSSILGGSCNTVCNSYRSSIVGCICNTLSFSSRYSSIVCGSNNNISGVSGVSSTMFSTIVGGCCNILYKSCNSNIFGGYLNNLGTSSYSSIVGGRFNTISGTLDFSGKSTTMFSTIIGGQCNIVSCNSSNSSIEGGYCNKVYSINSSILGGFCNTVSCNSNSSSILGGSRNSIASYSSNSSIVGGGSNNTICSVSGGSATMFSTIVGGYRNTLSCSRYSIVGGQCNTLSCSCNSAIIGGVCLTLTSNNCTVLVPNLLIAGSMSPNCGTNFGITQNIIITGSASLCFVNGILISVGP